MKKLGSLSVLFLFLFHSYSQTLTVNTNQLAFGNVNEISPDSMQLSITNNIGRDVTINEIRFYSKYGSQPFSTTSNNFLIPDGGTTSIWVKFSPQHNVLHNSELVILNDGLRGDISVDLLAQGTYSKTYYALTQNLEEENLKAAINIVTGNGYISLGYNSARDDMFMTIDNKKVNGQGASSNTLECIYTGREAVGYIDRTDCQNNFSFNTEHTFPQSLFSSNEPMRSDLHHLFPTDDVANNNRADDPFGIVASPSWTVGGSKSDGSTFEPRDLQKGASARAMFYFVLRYQNYSNYLNQQEAILRTWHQSFPPSSIEMLRNDDIFSVQNNRNPFVDYPQFIDRITSISANSIAPIVSSIDIPRDTIIYGYVPVNIATTYNFVVVNNGNTNVSFSNFNLSNAGILSFAQGGVDTVIAPGDALQLKVRCLTTVPDSIRSFLTFNSNANGNLAVSVPIFINDEVYSGIDEVHHDVTLYPNPAHGFVKIAGMKKSFDWKLFDITGKIIRSERSFANEINLNDVCPGLFILNIESENIIIRKKLIIE